LAAGLTPPERRSLAEAMVADVLDALRATAAVDGIVVVSAEPAVRRLAHRQGARWSPDVEEAGQSAAVAQGLRHADGATRALLVPGDCPAVDPAELTALLARPELGQRSVVVVPDRHGTGTNALVLVPPDAMAPAFGPGSRARHEAAAAQAGAACAIVPVPSLGLDVDTPEDLAALRVVMAAAPARAGHTRALLARIAPDGP